VTLVVPKPRFQIFLSSTFTDLQAERVAVTQALLRMQRCIPAGMEFFPASSRPPWDVIRPILDVTDYMVLLLAGRYGSVTEDGIGYTEREYDYAFGQDIPIVAFTCDLAAGLRAARRDSDELQLERLRRFKSKVAGRHTVQRWDTPENLASLVQTSLYQEFEAAPRPGWVRAGKPATEHLDVPEPGSSAAPFGVSDVVTRVDPASAGVSRPPSAFPRSAESKDEVDSRLREAVDALLESPALDNEAEVDGPPEFVSTEHGSRLALIESLMTPVLTEVVAIIAARDADWDREWLELVPSLAPNPRLSGSTDLINLRRAPGVFLYHFAGCAAAAFRRDDLIGRLLSEHLVVDDPYRGEAPAAATLTPDVVYPSGFASRRLHDFVIRGLSDAGVLGRRTAEECWARWTYLYSVQATYLSSLGFSSFSGWPHLEVEGTHQTALRVTVGKTIRREFAEYRDEHASLRSGLCGSSFELFEAAAITFESNYGSWASDRDWVALPTGGGVLPSGPHFPS
jgi:hypothetical protein